MWEVLWFEIQTFLMFSNTETHHLIIATELVNWKKCEPFDKNLCEMTFHFLYVKTRRWLDSKTYDILICLRSTRTIQKLCLADQQSMNLEYSKKLCCSGQRWFEKTVKLRSWSRISVDRFRTSSIRIQRHLPKRVSVRSIKKIRGHQKSSAYRSAIIRLDIRKAAKSWSHWGNLYIGTYLREWVKAGRRNRKQQISSDTG
jgi:hypothetical protein